jgi:hypothetical protein
MTDANGGDVEDLIKSAPPETASSGIAVGGETDHPVKDFKSAPVVAGGETDPVKKLFAIGIVTFVVALVVGVSIALGVNSSGKSGELFFSSGWCVCVVLIIFCAR